MSNQFMKFAGYLLPAAIAFGACQPRQATVTPKIPNIPDPVIVTPTLQPNDGVMEFTPTAVAGKIPNPLVHGFKLYTDEPVLSMGSSGSWDSGLMDPGGVVFHEGQFHMFYNAVPYFPSTIAVGFATSADGITWTRVVTEPVFTIENISWQPKPTNLRANSVMIVDDTSNTVSWVYTPRSYLYYFAIRINMSTPELSLIEKDEDIDRLLPQITNWGRWGKQDQLGTVNFITARQRLKAISRVKKGRTVSLAREISVTKTEGIRRGTYEMMREEDGSRDYVGMIFHGFALTHLDALCHAFAAQDKMYNGFSVEEVTADGANKLGVERMATKGISGRGILLDIATVKGAILEPGTPLFPKDLEKAEEAQRVVVEEGDILFVRTGAGARNTREQRSGLHPQCLPWLHERNVAVLGSDGDNDVHPSGFTRWESAMHSVAIPYMGLPLLDNAELDALSQVCQEEKRWEFFLTIAPWRLHGTTSSPVNPIALF